MIGELDFVHKEDCRKPNNNGGFEAIHQSRNIAQGQIEIRNQLIELRREEKKSRSGCECIKDRDIEKKQCMRTKINTGSKTSKQHHQVKQHLQDDSEYPRIGETASNE